MRALQVQLKQEVTRNDAIAIMKWMENHEVTMYLNEFANISLEIKQAIDRVNMMIMTHLFNRDGSFYIINADESQPVGFLKLVRNVSEAEMVIVIGDQEMWGHGLGKAAISKALGIAFFQWRLKRVTAKIKPDNVRSVKAFESSGFKFEKDLNHLMLYSISQEDYIKQFI